MAKLVDSSDSWYDLFDTYRDLMVDELCDIVKSGTL